MRAAFYESDVTPPLGGFMWGHYREIRAEEVHERLYAKAVVVEDGADLAAIVVVDTCVLPPEMHDIVTKRIFDYTGITADKICIASNHAHTGAPVSDGPEVGCYADATYKDVFFRLVADTVILAYKRLSEVEIKFAETEVLDIAKCRNHVLKDGSIITHGATNPDIVRHLAEPDRAFPFLMFYKEEKPIGAIINFACHQDTTGGVFSAYGYCGDYASILAKELKKHYGNDFVSLFLLGAAGDINTASGDPNAKRWRYTDIGKRLAQVFVDTVDSSTPVIGGVKAIKESVRIKRRLFDDPQKAHTAVAECIAGQKNGLRGRNLLYYISTNKKDFSDLYVQGILIGDVYISMLPGEIFTDIGRDVKTRSPFKKNIVVENCNSYCGYIPTKEAFSEKSRMYEISLCNHSCHVPEACDIIADKAVEIAEKMK